MTTAEAAALLVALQECREAAAAAMRVLVRHGLSEAFTAELARCGVREGFGARADRAIASVGARGMKEVP
jgi:hypothetical protein